VLAAYLFLHVINPDLVSGTLKAPSDAVDKIVAPFIVMPGADGEECKSLVGFIVVHPSAPPCSECQNGFDPATAICGPPAI
ncbi:MAG: hypothetical protein KAQ63_03730, partial [Candidatus Moranbacteria bacterium]|nr:hypothetical protein [Candidatus Moranbacteria bacterium]